MRAKALAAHRAGLTAIVCIGEQRAEREAGQTLAVIGRQLDGSLPDGGTGANLVVAYEPVWAIGSGLTRLSPISRKPMPSSARNSTNAKRRRRPRPDPLRRLGQAR